MSTCLIIGGGGPLITWWRWCLLGFFSLKLLFFPHLYFCLLQAGHYVQFTLKGRRVKLHPLKEGMSKNLWMYVETTTVLINIFREILKAVQMSCFSLNFCPLILAFLSRFFLQQELLWCPNGGFLFSSIRLHLLGEILL